VILSGRNGESAVSYVIAHTPKKSRTDKMTDKENAHVYEVRPCKDKRGVDLISDALPFGRLW
jgi:hypothetical protein